MSASGRKATGLTGVAAFMAQFERTSAPKRVLQSTSKTLKELKKKKREEKLKEVMGPLIEEYRKEQRESSGEFRNMNCYNTLFVGRLAYEVTERKLLREFESFGAVKDIKLVPVKGGEREGKSKGYAFVEFEQEDDMKRAYRSADGMRIEGREIVVDVERGHTVPNWLPRRLGGGLGGTRLGSKEKNVTRPGRFDPSRPEQPPPQGPPMGYGGGREFYNDRGGPGPPRGGGYGHGPPPGRGGYDDRGPPGGGGGGYGGPRGGYNDRGPPPGGGGGYHDRGGPPPRRGQGPPDRGPPDRYGGGGPRYGGGDRGGDRGMKRDRDYGDDRGGGYRRRY